GHLGAGRKAVRSKTLVIVRDVGAVVVLQASAFVGMGRRRQVEKKREEAAGLRDEAQTRARSAKQAELAAEEHAERAKRERAAAEEHAARAREVDPDVDDTDGDRASDRQDIAAR